MALFSFRPNFIWYYLPRIYKRRDKSVKTGKEKIVDSEKNMNVLRQQNVTGIKHIMTEGQRKG